MTNSSDTTIADEVLASGADDWVSAAEVYGLTVEYTSLTSSENRRDLALGVIARLIVGGYVEPGDTPRGGGGFVPWGGSVDEAVARIIGDWSRRTDDLTPGEVVWLRNTPIGDERGEAVLARKGNQDNTGDANTSTPSR